jgi:hypothetical protein
MKGTVIRVTPTTKQALQYKGTPQWLAWMGAKRYRSRDYRVLRFVIAADSGKVVEVEDRACADNESIVAGDPIIVGSGSGVGDLLYCAVRLDTEAMAAARKTA